MNKDEVVKTLLTRAKIDPGFTTLVWQKLEEENADFFRAYYIRLKLKKQILLFNHLLEHQYHLMKCPMPAKVPLAPIQNGIHPMPGKFLPSHQSAYECYSLTPFVCSAVNNLPMGYPVLQQPPMPATGQPHIDSMGCGLSSCHVVNGVPASGNFHPIRMNSGNDMMMDHSAPDMVPVIPPNGTMSSVSEMPVSPTSVASSGHFPFTASEIPGMGADTSALDTAFTSDVASSVGLQLAADGGNGISRSLDQIQWNFSLSDLTADLPNLGVNNNTQEFINVQSLLVSSCFYCLEFFADLGALGNYPGSPFLPSDSDILLESPDQQDIVDDFFVNSEPPCSQSDEEKS
ncbi:hypothetical protein GmHk_07G018544 [Glycine max]|nr:hypothetical protein GmHk_07G018544 [Glycine max]